MQSWLAQKSCLVCCCLSLTVVYSDRHMGFGGLACTCIYMFLERGRCKVLCVFCIETKRSKSAITVGIVWIFK